MGKIKIMLDPGHDSYYSNPGVVKGYYEGARMWRLAELLKPKLEKRGFEVCMTKKQVNHAITVVTRGRMADGYGALISLHSNACDTESVDRPVGIYFVDDNCGKIDETSKDLATVLAQAVENAMGTNGKAQVYERLASGDRDGDGRRNDDYYGVLYGAHQVGVAAIILEHSFHTNRAATNWLLSDTNLEALAEAEANALAAYYGTDDSTDTAPEEKPTQPQQPAQTAAKWYRVRKSWDDAKSQLGAFVELQHAKLACAAGYSVFDDNGNVVYTKAATAYTLEQFVRDVQQATGAAVDGIAGPETIGKTVTLSQHKNATHAAVKAVQKRLAVLGFDQVGEADGEAGPKFTAAVKAFQKANGCTPDGEITAKNKTWRKLLGME